LHSEAGTRTGSARRRAIAIAVGAALGAALALPLWFAWRSHRERSAGEIQVVGSRADVDALLEERARGARPPPPLVAGEAHVRPLQRELIPESVAVRLFPQIEVSRAGVMYDPHTYFRLRPNLVRKIPFAERPEGEWTYRTNGAGLREDAEIASTKPDLRALVAGDSHTEGMCNNRESYPNVLEAGLAARHPGRSVDVLNAAKSGYSFYNYLGVLERFLDLHPDVFVMGVYGGNDFIESTTLHHYFQRTSRERCEACDYESIVRLHPDVTTNIFQQAFMQLMYFRHHPEERATALEAACSVTAEVERVCREHSIRLLVLYIPPFADVQPKFLGQVYSDAVATFALTPDDLEITNRIVDEYLADTRKRGVECIDLRPRFRAETMQLYWDRDHHVNVLGNRIVAEELLSRIEPALR
jgi:hypothetical protein